jgi:hypothetical protein
MVEFDRVCRSRSRRVVIADMRQFSGLSDFGLFLETIKRTSRYCFDNGVREFLETVAETAQSRTLTLSAGNEFWRAQRSDAWETEYLPLGTAEELEDEEDRAGPADYVSLDISGIEYSRPCPFPAMRMKPLLDSAPEGRLNPKGIPYLYLADDHETAMAETRPWGGAYVTLASLRTNRELKVVDCSADTQRPDVNPPITAEKAEKIAWFLICDAFSTPVERRDDSGEYAPTQVLGEKFRSVGFDGVKCKSELGNGCNVALFDVDAADVIEPCRLFQAKSVSYVFGPPDNVIKLSGPGTSVKTAETIQNAVVVQPSRSRRTRESYGRRFAALSSTKGSANRGRHRIAEPERSGVRSKAY